MGASVDDGAALRVVLREPLRHAARVLQLGAGEVVPAVAAAVRKAAGDGDAVELDRTLAARADADGLHAVLLV